MGFAPPERSPLECLTLRKGAMWPLASRNDPHEFVTNMFENPFHKAVSVLDGRVTVHDEAAIASPAMDKLAYTAVFGDQVDRDDARWLIWEIGQAVGVQPWSIHDLYLARGRGETKGFTVPAMNIRGMVYDTARSLFRAAVTWATSSARSSSRSRAPRSLTRISARRSTSP